MAQPPILIFVHGLYGSNLERRSQRQWLSPGTILRSCCCRCNRGHTNIALPITWTGDVQDSDDLEPSSVLELGYGTKTLSS